MMKSARVEKDRVWSEFSTLLLDAQYQVIEFMTFLHTRYAPEESAKLKTPNLRDEPFVGLWKDRKEMQDSTVYVRKLRQQEWGTCV